MAEPVDQDELALRQRARRRAQAKIAFYVHAAAFVGVNAFLFVLDLLTSPGDIWFYWALLGWGVGLVAHAFSVYVKDVGDSWFRKIEQRELDRMRQEHDRSISL